MARTGKASRGVSGPGTGSLVRLCGCYYEVETDSERTTKPLPRVDVAARTTIFSTASETELKQTFVNPSETENIPECRYVFPLYDGVSVVAFTCQIGSRLIHGVVKEKAKAKEVFDNAVSRGETAGLLEQSPSTDVFTTILGNIPAGEKLLVQVKYIGELKHDTALEGIRFTLPTFISPRYGSGNPQGDMDSTSTGGISIIVDINMPKVCPIEEVRSPSHPIALSLGKTSMQNDSSSDLSRASATLSLVSMLFPSHPMFVQQSPRSLNLFKNLGQTSLSLLVFLFAWSRYKAIVECMLTQTRGRVLRPSIRILCLKFVIRIAAQPGHSWKPTLPSPVCESTNPSTSPLVSLLLANVCLH